MEMPSMVEKLRREARRLTGPRRAILELLARQSHPLSNKEIFLGLAPRQCDLATVYRSMHLLETMGFVKRYALGDGVARFELAREGADGHHHHLVCIRCSEVIELDECFMRDVEERIAARNGFKAITHNLEFFGVCPTCQ